MDDTSTFIQIRSAPIRLRRALQQIGLATPLDVSHHVLLGAKTVSAIKRAFTAEGCTEPATERAIAEALSDGFLSRTVDGALHVSSAREEIVRRFFLLDHAARTGATVDPRGGDGKGMLLVPGFGPFFGSKIDDLVKSAVNLSPTLRAQWSRSPEIVLGDLRWLDEQGFAMLT